MKAMTSSKNSDPQLPPTALNSQNSGLFCAMSLLIFSAACQATSPPHSSQEANQASAKSSTQHRHERRALCSQQHSTPQVIDHKTVPTFVNQGNEIQGLVSAATGSRQFEVWRSKVAPGGSTPPHTHSSDEVFIILQGEGKVRIGNEFYPFIAPATLVAPANKEHQLTNTGSVETEQYVIVSACSEIHDHEGSLMALPWRK